MRLSVATSNINCPMLTDFQKHLCAMPSVFIVCMRLSKKIFHRLWRNLKMQIFHNLWKICTTSCFLSKLYPKEVEGTIPSIKELEEKLEKETEDSK